MVDESAADDRIEFLTDLLNLTPIKKHEHGSTYRAENGNAISLVDPCRTCALRYLERYAYRICGFNNQEEMFQKTGIVSCTQEDYLNHGRKLK